MTRSAYIHKGGRAWRTATPGVQPIHACGCRSPENYTTLAVTCTNPGPPSMLACTQTRSRPHSRLSMIRSLLIARLSSLKADFVTGLTGNRELDWLRARNGMVTLPRHQGGAVGPCFARIIRICDHLITIMVHLDYQFARTVAVHKS